MARTNLVLAYPEIPSLAKKISMSVSDDSFYPMANLIGGHKYAFCKLATAGTSANYNFRLGTPRPVEYMILGRADSLVSSGITQAVLQSSSDDVTYTGRIGTGANLATRTRDDSRSQDCLFMASFNDEVGGSLPTSSFIYWRLVLSGSSSLIPFSKLFCGSFFDFGGDPEVLEKGLDDGDPNKSITGLGARTVRRLAEPRYKIRLKWRNVTNAKRDSFLNDIQRQAVTRNGVYLVARDDSEVLDGYRLMYTFLDVTSVEYVTKADNVHEITATFYEEIG